MGVSLARMLSVFDPPDPPDPPEEVAVSDEWRSGGGMASLGVSQAHLGTLLSATDGLDGRAMFLGALNLALFGVMVGVVAALDQPLWAIVPSGVVLVVAAVLTWRIVQPREIEQFPSAAELLRLYAGSGHDDDTVAWLAVEAIAWASAFAVDDLRDKARKTRWLAALSLLQAGAFVFGLLI